MPQRHSPATYPGGEIPAIATGAPRNGVAWARIPTMTALSLRPPTLTLGARSFVRGAQWLAPSDREYRRLQAWLEALP